MTWYLYEIGPIDYNWQYMKTVNATAKELGSATAEVSVFGSPEDTFGEQIDISEFLGNWKREGATLFRDRKELRCPPVVFWIPHEDGFKYGFVVKLDNNGTTYVASPVELPHLGKPLK